jgi:hypothetical protein
VLEGLHVLYSSPTHCAGDKIEENEIGGACTADGEGEMRVQDFVEKT